MKKSNVFGAVLCSAALACSMAMPAFADTTKATQADAIVGGASTFTDSGKTQVTTVKGKAYDDTTVENYISATVPATLTVVLADPSVSATANGGAFKFVPSPNSYKVVNSSTGDLKITKIAGASVNSDWVLDTATNVTTAPGNSDSNNYLVSISINGNDVCTTAALGDSAQITVPEGGEQGLQVAGKAYWKNSMGTKAALGGGGAVNIVEIAYTVELVTA